MSGWGGAGGVIISGVDFSNVRCQSAHLGRNSGDTSGAGAGGAGQVDENICFISIFNITSLLSQRIINISVGCFS